MFLVGLGWKKGKAKAPLTHKNGRIRFKKQHLQSFWGLCCLWCGVDEQGTSGAAGEAELTLNCNSLCRLEVWTSFNTWVSSN